MSRFGYLFKMYVKLLYAYTGKVAELHFGGVLHFNRFISKLIIQNTIFWTRVLDQFIIYNFC